MLALYIYVILFFAHSLLCQEKEDKPENSKPKTESKKIKNSKDEWPDSSGPSSSSTSPFIPSLSYSIAISNWNNKNKNKTQKTKPTDFDYMNRLGASNPLQNFYHNAIPGAWLSSPEAHEKIKKVFSEVSDIIKDLNKCKNPNVTAQDLRALNDLTCWKSDYINKELQKTKYNIQQGLYDRETGEFKGMTADGKDIIEKEIDKFKLVVKRWVGNPTKVYNSRPLIYSGTSKGPYSEKWDKKIKNNEFNRKLDKFIELCEDTPNLANFKKNLIKANEILKLFDGGFKSDHPQYNRYLILNRIHIEGTNRYQTKLHQQENKNLEQLLLNPGVHIPSSWKEARFKSWQEGNDKKLHYRTEKSYGLTNEAKDLYQKLGLDTKLFSNYSGIPIHHALGEEFASLANTAGHMYSHGIKEEAQELAKEIATYSDIGLRFMEKDLILQAMYTANFCWALVDCGKAMGEGVIQGIEDVYDSITHPIETAYQVAETAKTAGHYFGKLMWIMFAEEDLIEEDPEKMERLTEHRIGKINTAIEALKEKYNSTSRHDLIKNTAALATRTALTNKIISAGIKTMYAANKKVGEFAKKLGKAEEAGIPLTAENVPWQVNFSDEATNSLIQKTTKTSGTSKKSFEALQSGFKTTIEGIEEILPEVAKLDNNKIHHILNPKHAWEKLVHKEKDWESISRIISKVMKEGAEELQNNGISYKKCLEIGSNTIEVTFAKNPNGEIVIGNAWIKTTQNKN